jgi:hypothetical protein
VAGENCITRSFIIRTKIYQGDLSIRWTQHVGCTEVRRNENRVFVGKLEDN